MSHALTEVDVFDASITVPDGADPRTAASVIVGMQGLANRTKNLKNRVAVFEQHAQYTIAAASLANGDKLTLTEVYEVGGFTLSDSNRQLQFPAEGIYLVTYSLLATYDGNLDAGDQLLLAALLGSDPNPSAAAAFVATTGIDGEKIVLHASALVAVAGTLSTRKLCLRTSIIGTNTPYDDDWTSEGVTLDALAILRIA